MSIEFKDTTEPTGLEVYDSIEQRRLQIKTSKPIFPTPVPTENFHFPVDKSCTFETTELVFDQLYSVTIHNETGRAVQNLDAGDSISFDDGTQFVGLSGPIRLYVQLDCPAMIQVGMKSIRISLGTETTVGLGMRSLHEHPAETITTPREIEPMMKAVSAFPSALKTTSPERAWPTLRGHPPLVELGDELQIPDAIDQPDNDIRITIPPDYRNLFYAAPLAFYLGATVQPGSEPTLETAEFDYSLGSECELEDEFARLLKQIFFLDCLTRTEGIFGNKLHERTTLEGEIPFDLAETYSLSLSEQLERYLDIPYGWIEQHIPRWPLTAHLPSTPSNVELLPFIVNELGIIRETRGNSRQQVARQDPTNAQFVRSASEYRTENPDLPSNGSPFVTPSVTEESIEHAWFGDDIPLSASKASIEAYRSQLSRGSLRESIEILLVCNDARMTDEHDFLDQTYGNRETLPFDIDSEFGVSTDRLAELLTDGGYDFVHYIGHATEDGIKCLDGDLDVRTLESVDVGVFFLNACRSYEQGLALTQRGAHGGVSTYNDVINEYAVETGEMMARLLNRGFSLRGALEITRENSTLGDEYLIVGDGSVDIAQTEGGAPSIISLEEHDDSEFGFALQSYSTKEFKLGSVTASALEAVDDLHLSPGQPPASRVEKQPLEEYLTWTELPVLIDGDLRWNDGIGPLPIN
ncbi:hypothetical protein [Halostagnicola sp. A-GB9-2]|uniref:hypothetical protein n=1 Tax=Halostagnicola sp. A-GB9-2 TaxID=3048066 RepID=UPI0024C09EF8|nr:hypothetical protein [Halostagnicola sp. A-GB9-2]MDJ1430960.1 hypothetical protein [Halostagnicola sp. A-GB9-2]